MNILLLESIPLLEAALVAKLKFSGHSVTTHAPRTHELMASLDTVCWYELLWMDTCIFSEGGHHLMKVVRKRSPGTKILLFGVNETIPEIKNYYRQGGHGYLKKSSTGYEIDQAMQQISADGVYVSFMLTQELSKWVSHVSHHHPTIMNITPREKEVLRLIVEEYTTKEMAQKLFICPSTVETHRMKLISKLGVKNTAGLVRVAVETGIHL